MLFDPVDFAKFLQHIKVWANHSELLVIPPKTEALFCERELPHHSPRALSNLAFKPDPSVFNFYVAAPQVASSKSKGLLLPPAIAGLIDRINLHNPFLSILGILPNQLRSLLKIYNLPHYDDALVEISQSLFFAGFRIWQKRQSLHRHFWKNIAPQNRKPIAKGRKKKLELIAVESKCKNLFHYLPRLSNLTNLRPTKCPCSVLRTVTTPKTNRDIRSFLFAVPAQSSRSHVAAGDYKTRAYAIRRAHDRGKKRKPTLAGALNF